MNKINTDAHLQTAVSIEWLIKRKGRLIVSRQLILQSNQQVLKEIFSNFFPIDADRNHNNNFWDHFIWN
jgi:hypothetical protein